MTFKFKYTDKIVGIFFFIAVGLIVAMLAVIIVNQKIFVKKHYFKTRFEDGGDLKVDQDIYFKGFKIGKVKKISLNEQNKVDVDLFIYEQYLSRVKKDSVFSKVSNPITGGKIILIQNEISFSVEKEGSFIPSLESFEGQTLLKMGAIKKESDKISGIINTVDSVLLTVDDLLKSINDDNNASKNSIARILVNAADTMEKTKEQLEKVSVILGNFENLSYQMREPDGMIKKLIDPQGDFMFNSIQKSLNSLSIMMDELSQFSGFINGQSRQIESLLIESKNTMKEAQEVIEGIKNNPLIKGGITEKKEQETIKDSVRDKDDRN